MILPKKTPEVSVTKEMTRRQLREKKLAKALHDNIRKRRQQLRMRQSAGSPAQDLTEKAFETAQRFSA
jgi:AAA+ superfamily predicted ATPase